MGNRYKASIIHNNDNCYICGVHATEWHHIFFGSANRKLSEKYGLKVKLCHRCHRTGPLAVHTDKRVNAVLKEVAQKKFEEVKGTRTDFIEVFGKNYL